MLKQLTRDLSFLNENTHALKLEHAQAFFVEGSVTVLAAYQKQHI